MYRIVDDDYQRLETYLCYECGFYADTILMSNKSLYQEYQKVFSYSGDILKLKKLPKPSTEGNTKKSTDKEPVPQNNIFIRYWYRTLR